MNIINVKVNFTKGTCETSGINLITGDYNSTKMVFEFDRTDGTKVFEMKSPSEQLVMVQEIQNNEIPLYALTDEDEIASLFSEDGYYVFEISLYNEGSKLTSVSSKIKVKPEQVVIDGEVVEAYLPVFDQLLSQVDTALTETGNLDISVSKSGKTATITLTDKEGESHTTNIYDGKDFEYNWDGTKLGVRQEGDPSYTYVNLKGDKGEPGAIKMLVVDSLPVTGEDDTIYLVPITPDTSGNNYAEYVYINGAWELLGKIGVQVDLSGYYTKTETNNLLENKQNKITNDNKLSASLISGLNNVATSGSYNDLSNTPDLSLKEDKSNKTTTINSSSTDIQYSSAKAVYSSQNQRANQKKYSVIRKANTATTTWIRVDDNAGMIANATKNGSEVENSFDFVKPYCDIKVCNQNPTTKEIVAWLGDDDFKWDGTNGNVMVHIPEFYYYNGQIKIDGVLYDKISISDMPFEGSSKSEEFYISAKNTSVVDNKPVSYSGLGPEVNRSIVSFRTLYENNGYTQLDYRYFLLQMLYLVEYANTYSQSTLGNGITSVRYNANDLTLIAENNTNRVVIPTNTNFQVGNTICIGNSQGGYQIAKYRTITAINSYSSGDITGTELVFDGDAVDITVGKWVGCCGQLSGQTDTLGSKSGCLVNDSKHAVNYRGIENIFGNVWQWVDGINIKDNLAYINVNPSTYQSDKFDGDYHALGYTNANANNYVQELGYDENYPFARFPKVVGSPASYNNYYTDYYYQNSGNRVARVGGGFDGGAGPGLFCWALSGASGSTYVGIGSRFLYIPSRGF